MPEVRLHLSGFPADATEAQLAGRFSAFGQVRDVEIPLDKEDSTRRRGFAYLTVETDQVEALLKTYKGSKWLGTPFRVEIARPSLMHQIQIENVNGTAQDEPVVPEMPVSKFTKLRIRSRDTQVVIEPSNVMSPALSQFLGDNTVADSSQPDSADSHIVHRKCKILSLVHVTPKWSKPIAVSDDDGWSNVARDSHGSSLFSSTDVDADLSNVTLALPTRTVIVEPPPPVKRQKLDPVHVSSSDTYLDPSKLRIGLMLSSGLSISSKSLLSLQNGA